MAEGNAEVGALRISLGMESATFTQSMQDITRKIKGLNSEFQATAAGNKEFEKSLDGMKAKSGQLTGTLQLQEQRVKQLRAEYDRAVQEKGKDAKATENLLIRYNSAVAAMKRTESALNNVSKEIADAENKWKQLGKAATDAGDKMKSSADGMKSVGAGMTAGLTAPIAAFGIAAGKASMDVAAAQGKLQAQLGLTAEQAKGLNATAKNLWEDGFGDSIDGVSDAVARVYQTMGNLPVEEIEKVTKAAYTLSDTFEADVNETTRAAGQLMQQFGVSSTDAMDMLTVAFQRGGDYSGELLDSISEYSTQFANMGFSAEQMMGMFASGAESGIFSLDKLADTVKESFLQITDGAEGTRDSLKELGLDYSQIESDMAKGGEKANAAFGVVMTAIAGVSDEADRNRLAIELMGTPLEDLGPQYQSFFAQAGEGMTGFQGAAEKAADSVYDNFGTRLQGVWRESKAALVPLGETLVGMAEDVLPAVAETVEDVTEWFQELSPEGQKLAVGFGLATAAAGPLIAGLGFVAGGIGSLVSVGGMAIGALGVMAGITAGLSTALTVLTGPVGLTIAALAGIGYAAYKVSEELKKPAIESDIFSEKISESTQKAVGSYLKLDEEATLALNQLSWSQQTVTAEMAESLVAKYGEMGDRILESMNEKYTKQLESTQTYFANSAALTDQEEAAIVAKMQTNHANQQNQVAVNEEQIKAIMQKATEEKRALTEEERVQIATIQDQMRVSAVTTLSNGAVEQKAILAQLRAESSVITAEQAAAVVANSVKQKEGTVKEANDQYSKTVAEVIRMRDETGVISAEQAEKLISEAKKQRDGAVKNAEDMHQNVVKEAKAQAGEHVKEVDWTSGQVKSKWQVMKDDVAKKSRDMADQIIADSKRSYENFTKWTGDLAEKGKAKFADLKKGAKNVWDDMIGDMKELNQQMLFYAEKVVNGPIRGVNSVLVKLGMKDKQIGLWVPGYAEGTDGHPGGPALVNDGAGAFKELIQTPDGKVGMFSGRNVLVDLPRGSKVLPGGETKKLMDSGLMKNIPRYEDGIGMMDIFNLVTDPKALMNKVLGQFLTGLPKLSGAALSIGQGAGEKAKEGGIEWFKTKLSDMLGALGGSFSGGNAASWRQAIVQAALQMGETLSMAEINGIIAQINRESGGNQRIIQSSAVWDVNTAAGNPARGLLQYIPQTFASYRVPGFNNIYNGYHQLLAFFNNRNWRRDLPYGRRGWGPTGGTKYANGTDFHPGGPALVNDGVGPYQELIEFPNGRMGMYKARNVMVDLPRGSKVLPGAETKKLLQMGMLNDIPQYAAGVGDLTYVVKAGDTLTKIAKQFKTTVDALAKLNSIQNKNLIRVGQVLKYGTQTVKPVGSGNVVSAPVTIPKPDNRTQIEKDIEYLSKKYKTDMAERQQQFDAYVARRKQAGKMSTMQEIQTYRESLKYFKQYSAEWYAVEEKMNQAKVQLHNELTELKDDYLAKSKEINAQLIEEERRLNAEYANAVTDRANELKNFAGLFDEVGRPEEIDPQTLIDNLQDQVWTLNNFDSNLDILANRGVDQALIKELQEMGPKALAEIKALNDMTDSELNQFTGLWKDKSVIARNRATEELVGLREDTTKEIEQLHADAEIELDLLKETFIEKMTEIRTGATDEFQPFGAQMTDIGKNAIQGLIDGMDGVTGPLSRKMKEISALMIDTMKKELVIKSPSQKAEKEVSGYFGAGLISGLEKMKSPLMSKIGQVSDMFTGVVPIPDVPVSAFSSAAGGGNSYDYSTTMAPNVTLNYYGDGSEEDAFAMVDTVESELNWRYKNRAIVKGV